MSTTYQDLPFTSFPDAITSFVTMLNMTVEDGANVKGYQQAMQDGNTALAQNYYAQIINANQKFVDATKMNTLMNTCVALQRFYESDIEPYVDAKQAEWTGRINQFNYVGDYSASSQYYLNNFVRYNLNGVNRLYIATSQPPVGTLPTDTNHWREISIRGEQGVSGVGVSFRYGWSSSETYYLQDIVTYDNTVWSCVAQNRNQTPSFSSSYWKPIYTAAQVVYPFQSNQPSGMEEGYLWFKILG